MPKDDLVYIGHMCDVARKILAFVKDKTREDMARDETLSYALIHLIQIIGEAARHISQDFRVRHPEIPWSQIVGMRNVLVHDYMEINHKLVWKTVQEDLPPLTQALEKIAPSEPEMDE